ncbi:MAG: S-layer homology domain-containing protein [Lawsonibacter sp.]|nr:S-layer homology domain-containing protein [Lawsonibacter sp.]
MSTLTPAIIKPSLEKIILTAWEHCRVILFSAPCGCGKTTTATALLSGHTVCTLNAAAAKFLPENIPVDCDAVLVDDLQYLLEPARREALCNLIRTQTDLRFVLLGRGPVPGWLMPFQFAGILLTVETQALLFDRPTAQRMLESRGITVTPDEMSAIQRDLKGYPIAMDILCRKLNDGVSYSVDILNAVKRELFIYFEEAVYRRFELGITSGVGDNLFAPDQAITRQEMFTLLYNALKALDKLPAGNSGKSISDFSDAGNIASWATDAMTALVKAGTVTGNDGALNPRATTTRAEMAQVLYNLLGK